MPAAWPYVGRLEVAPDIGLTRCPLASESNWTLPGDFNDYPPAPAGGGPQGRFRSVGHHCRQPGVSWAAVLAARGAQRAQPGLITLYTPETIYPSVAAQLQAVMVGIWQPNLKLPGDFHAILAGPGLAAENLPDVLKATVRRLWLSSPMPMIADASALDWLPDD